MGYWIFLRLAGIEGGSADPDHRGWIDLTSYHHGVGRYGEDAAEDLQRDFGFSKVFDASSPLLALACSEGWRLGDAVLEVRGDDGGAPLLEIRLEDVRVSGWQTGGSPADPAGAPGENVQLRFERVEWLSYPAMATPEHRPVRAAWTSGEFREPARRSPS